MSEVGTAVAEQQVAAIDGMNQELAAAQDERDTARAEIARLQRELALWQGPVTVPTTEDCWRLFRKHDDMANWTGYVTRVFSVIAPES